VAQVIAVNAVHAGSGVSTVTANLAALLAMAPTALRVGVLDACLSAPTQHLLFGLPQRATHRTLNDYLQGRCRLEEATHALALDAGTATVHLVPADPDLAAVARADRQAYNVEDLGINCQRLAVDLRLDVLLIDTEAGLPPSTLATLAAAHTALLVLALDKQHYQATARTVAVADELPLARRKMLVNLASPSLRYDAVQTQVAQSYGWAVTAVVPYCDELSALGSASLFVVRYPAHPVTAALRQVAQGLAGQSQG
jgi:MinD-like ATPase involved in chromosome partitioning or flagellar assembly